MINLILLESKKCKRTYIYLVSFCAMLIPLMLTFFVYMSGNAFTDPNWDTYLTSLNLFYGIFLSGIIPSFLVITSVFSEFRSGTIKTTLFSGYSRKRIIISKMVFVCIYIILLYAAIAILSVILGLILGFGSSIIDIVRAFLIMLAVGAAATIFVPIMGYLTLLFRSFVPPLILTFLGTIGSVVLINMGNAFYYPWLLPTSIFFLSVDSGIQNILLPVIVLIMYFLVFLTLSILRFDRMEIDNNVK